jgi:hypothetical protein
MTAVMTSTERAKFDVSGMYAAHDGFRHDLERLARAAEGGPEAFESVHAGWENFKTQLDIHHRAEDKDLWPLLRKKVTRSPEHVRLLEEMELEHARIDPLVANIDATARAKGPGLRALMSDLAEALSEHLSHEEREALPLIQATLSAAEWQAFTTAIRRTQGIKGAATYLPWMLDGDPSDAQRRFLNGIPAPVRLVNRLVWQPRYRRRGIWPKEHQRGHNLG